MYLNFFLQLLTNVIILKELLFEVIFDNTIISLKLLDIITHLNTNKRFYQHSQHIHSR